MKLLNMIPILWACAQASAEEVNAGSDRSDDMTQRSEQPLECSQQESCSDDTALLSLEARLTQRSEQWESAVCKKFFSDYCFVTSMVPKAYADLKALFEGCCVSGGHPESLCTSIGAESFDMHKDEAFSVAKQDTLCTEMEAFGKAHALWRKDKTETATSLAQADEKVEHTLDHTVERKEQDPEILAWACRKDRKSVV